MINTISHGLNIHTNTIFFIIGALHHRMSLEYDEDEKEIQLKQDQDEYSENDHESNSYENHETSKGSEK